MLPHNPPAQHLDYLLTAYLFENLSTAGKTEVESHLAHCTECRTQLEELRATLGLCALAFDDGGKTYKFEEERRKRVLEAAQKGRASFFERGGGATFRKWSWRLGAAAALLMVLAVAIVPVLFRSRMAAHYVGEASTTAPASTTAGTSFRADTKWQKMYEIEKTKKLGGGTEDLELREAEKREKVDEARSHAITMRDRAQIQQIPQPATAPAISHEELSKRMEQKRLGQVHGGQEPNLSYSISSPSGIAIDAPANPGKPAASQPASATISTLSASVAAQNPTQQNTKLLEPEPAKSEPTLLGHIDYGDRIVSGLKPPQSAAPTVTPQNITVEVPDAITEKAEIGDHFETIDPNKPNAPAATTLGAVTLDSRVAGGDKQPGVGNGSGVPEAAIEQKSNEGIVAGGGGSPGNDTPIFHNTTGGIGAGGGANPGANVEGMIGAGGSGSFGSARGNGGGFGGGSGGSANNGVIRQRIDIKRHGGAKADPSAEQDYANAQVGDVKQALRDLDAKAAKMEPNPNEPESIVAEQSAEELKRRSLKDDKAIAAKNRIQPDALNTQPEPIVPEQFKVEPGAIAAKNEAKPAQQPAPSLDVDYVMDDNGRRDPFTFTQNIAVLPQVHDGDANKSPDGTFLGTFNGDLDADTSVANGREQAKKQDIEKKGMIDAEIVAKPRNNRGPSALDTNAPVVSNGTVTAETKALFDRVESLEQKNAELERRAGAKPGAAPVDQAIADEEKLAKESLSTAARTIGGYDGGTVYNFTTVNPNPNDPAKQPELPPVAMSVIPQGGTAPLSANATASHPSLTPGNFTGDTATTYSVPDASTDPGASSASAAAKGIHETPAIIVLHPRLDPYFPNTGNPNTAQNGREHPEKPANPPIQFGLNLSGGSLTVAPLPSGTPAEPLAELGANSNPIRIGGSLYKKEAKKSDLAVPEFNDGDLGFSLNVTPSPGRDLKTINLHLNPAIDSINALDERIDGVYLGTAANEKKPNLEQTGVEWQGLDTNTLKGDLGDLQRIPAPTGFLQPRVPASTDTSPPNLPFPGFVAEREANLKVIADVTKANNDRDLADNEGRENAAKLKQAVQKLKNLNYFEDDADFFPNNPNTASAQDTTNTVRAPDSIRGFSYRDVPKQPSDLNKKLEIGGLAQAWNWNDALHGGIAPVNGIQIEGGNGIAAKDAKDIALGLANMDAQNTDADKAYQNRQTAQNTTQELRSKDTELYRIRISKMLEKAKELYDAHDYSGAEQMAQRVLINDPMNEAALGWKNKAVASLDAADEKVAEFARDRVDRSRFLESDEQATAPLNRTRYNDYSSALSSPVLLQGLTKNILPGNDAATNEPAIAYIPPVFETRTRKVCVTPATSTYETIPTAIYEIQKYKVQINANKPNETPVFEERERRVCVNPATCTTETIPSVFKDEEYRVCVQPESLRFNSPATEELYLRGFRALRAENPKLTLQQFARRPDVVHPVPLTDEGLDEDDYVTRYGTRPFVDCARDHLSTFGMDTDTAAYTLARSTLRAGNLPDAASVRVEEFVNYFKQDYRVESGEAFGVFAESAQSPFVDSPLPPGEGRREQSERGVRERELLKIGIKSRPARPGERKPAMLTFVIDTSGSMSELVPQYNKLTRLKLVQNALRELVNELNSDDAVSIVGFGAQAELLLPRTQARQKQRILDAIDALSAHGETNVEAGLNLGYRLADEAYAANAANRMILFSDGVANVGAKGPDEILKLVKIFASRGVDLSTVGVGMGKFNDPMMRTLADEGNGSCHYADSPEEAKKILIEKLPPHLNVLAKDAKVQVDFNVDTVKSYRLLGYEKRKMADADFRNDKVTAGEVTHDTLVTAFYEIVRQPGTHGPLGKVYLRWKDAGSPRLDVVERNYPLDEGIYAGPAEKATPDFRFLACVARFAELLRDSKWTRQGSYAEVLAELDRLPNDFKSKPECQEVIELVTKAQQLSIAKWKTDLK